MYAIVETGGKQYRAEVGKYLEIERLRAEVGDPVKFERVLLVRDEQGTRVGTPTLSGAVVNGKITSTIKGPKLIIYKMRRRQGTRLKAGHRQKYHKVEITSIDIE